MSLLLRTIDCAHSPESLTEALREVHAQRVLLLRTGTFETPGSRYSFVVAEPFLTFRCHGSRCELRSQTGTQVLFGDPWQVLDSLMTRFELLEELDLPFPLGGCFGFWGYDLKNFIEPRLRRQAQNDLEMPDCDIGFYDSLVVFDHLLGKTWIISIGLTPDGTRDPERARIRLAWWRERLESATGPATELPAGADQSVQSNTSRERFLAIVRRAQAYIRAGDIYQVNLSQRLAAPVATTGWELFLRLTALSPAPFSAYLDGGDFEIACSSPEQFLQISGRQIRTRPIKGTRPRSADPGRDTQLGYELRTSSKENAELVMITDLLRNDLGRVCDFGTVQVPELMRLECYPHVQHLVSTVEGVLRQDATHSQAFRSCFPGGSITGAPKFRAMEIIDELEPVARGPYTGSIGYLGFNRESQLNIVIRTALIKNGIAYFQVGAGIVADSVPEAEYEETLAKAGGFTDALRSTPCRSQKSVHRTE